jgi:hypothetical protein
VYKKCAKHDEFLGPKEERPNLNTPTPFHELLSGAGGRKLKVVMGLHLGSSYSSFAYTHKSGQNELITTNALVGRSDHWMGCVFSFDVKWGSS